MANDLFPTASLQETQAVRLEFVKLARDAGGMTCEGADKSQLSVEFLGGSSGVNSAVNTLKALQSSKLVEAAEIPAIKPLPGSEAKIANATIKVFSGGRVSLSFIPPADMDIKQVTKTLQAGALQAQHDGLMASQGLPSGNRR